MSSTITYQMASFQPRSESSDSMGSLQINTSAVSSPTSGDPWRITAKTPPPPYTHYKCPSPSAGDIWCRMNDRPPPLPPRPRHMVTLCHLCGQFHEADVSHLYDYHQAVDEDLTCQICLQPLVEPVDTRCGHTFCAKCIQNYLKFQKLCPIDRNTLATRDVALSSIMVRRLLDKLLVVCPNVDYCEEVLPRCDLEAHLAHRCKGAVTKCVKAEMGCTFQGPRSALQSHLWECPYRDTQSGISSMCRLPVVEGEVTSIDIQRGCYDLGISVVGGIDTPLMCVVIQEVFPEGVVAKDSRLQPGDQILEANGLDLTNASHYEAKEALSQVYPICRLTVYREKAEEHSPIEKEEILKITLPKVPGQQLGIKLVSKKNAPGLYVLETITGGVASVDSRLKKDDRILEINNQDMLYGTQEQAAQIIQASVERVQFIVSRKSRPVTCERLKPMLTQDCLLNCSLLGKECIFSQQLKQSKEKLVTIAKEPTESLGISVAGGFCSARGDVPIYITNLQPNGCLGRSKLVKKGDVLLTINGNSLLDLPHGEAVRLLKTAAECRSVSLKLLDGLETAEPGFGNFTPSWKFWLSMPIICHSVKTISLDRTPSGTLGFSIVGGCNNGHGPVPIYIKSVVPETPAGKDGRLRSGDMLLSVNGQTLEGVSHTVAVTLLKGSKGTVTLRVVSWPGTPV